MEIKFRAWDKDLNEMYGWSHMLTGYMQGYLTGYYNVELMQYTGLKDKNGVDIYAGDIFKTRWPSVLAVVEWDEGGSRFLGWTLEHERKIVYVGQEPAVEVIGNRWENPNLLGAPPC